MVIKIDFQIKALFLKLFFKSVSKGSNRSGLYASSPSLAHIDEFEDELDRSGSSLINPPFRPSPISAKKSGNPARTEANLATNANQSKGDAHPGRGDAHPDRRDAHSDRRDAHPDRRDAYPDRRDAHPERKDAHPERRDGHPERRDAHPERRDAHPERRDSHPERRDSHPEKRDAHLDRSDPTKKATIPVKTGRNLANKLDGNQTQNSLSSAQKGADPHPEEAGIEQADGSPPDHGIVANKGKIHFFINFTLND